MSQAGPNLSTKGTYAVAKFNGRTIHFGKSDDPESKRRFDEFKARWLLNGRQLPDERPTRGSRHRGSTAVSELAERYLADLGLDSNSSERIPRTVHVLVELFGTLRADEFSPKALKVVRERFIADGHVRNEVNRKVTEIRSMFTWAVGEELVPPDVLVKLKAVKGIRKRQTSAKESKKKRIPTADELDDVIPLLPTPYDAILTVLRYTGARVTEVLRLRPRNIVEQGDDVWLIVHDEHKTDWHEGVEVREIHVGPRAQAALRPYILRPADQLLFPEVSDHRAVGQFLDRAIRKANAARAQQGRPTIDHFCPSSMRHFVLDGIEDVFEAQAVAGHTSIDQQKVYRRQKRMLAAERAKRHG